MIDFGLPQPKKDTGKYLLTEQALPTPIRIQDHERTLYAKLMASQITTKTIIMNWIKAKSASLGPDHPGYRNMIFLFDMFLTSVKTDPDLRPVYRDALTLLRSTSDLREHYAPPPPTSDGLDMLAIPNDAVQTAPDPTFTGKHKAFVRVLADSTVAALVSYLATRRDDTTLTVHVVGDAVDRNTTSLARQLTAAGVAAHITMYDPKPLARGVSPNGWNFVNSNYPFPETRPHVLLACMAIDQAMLTAPADTRYSDLSTVATALTILRHPKVFHTTEVSTVHIGVRRADGARVAVFDIAGYTGAELYNGEQTLPPLVIHGQAEVAAADTRRADVSSPLADRLYGLIYTAHDGYFSSPPLPPPARFLHISKDDRAIHKPFVGVTPAPSVLDRHATWTIKANGVIAQVVAHNCLSTGRDLFALPDDLVLPAGTVGEFVVDADHVGYFNPISAEGRYLHEFYAPYTTPPPGLLLKPLVATCPEAVVKAAEYTAAFVAFSLPPFDGVIKTTAGLARTVTDGDRSSSTPRSTKVTFMRTITVDRGDPRIIGLPEGDCAHVELNADTYCYLRDRPDCRRADSAKRIQKIKASVILPGAECALPPRPPPPPYSLAPPPP